MNDDWTPEDIRIIACINDRIAAVGRKQAAYEAAVCWDACLNAWRRDVGRPRASLEDFLDAYVMPQLSPAMHRDSELVGARAMQYGLPVKALSL